MILHEGSQLTPHSLELCGGPRQPLMVTHRINPTISSSLSLHDAEAESQAHGAKAGGPTHWVENTAVRSLWQRHPYYVVAKLWHATERVHRMQLPLGPDVAGNKIMATG